jgi:hypothetical protein
MMDDDKIVAAILATAMTDNRWTAADADDLVRRYRTILDVLLNEPQLNREDVSPDLG